MLRAWYGILYSLLMVSYQWKISTLKVDSFHKVNDSIDKKISSYLKNRSDMILRHQRRIASSLGKNSFFSLKKLFSFHKNPFS